MSILLQRFSTATGKTIISVQQDGDDMVVTAADKQEFRTSADGLASMDDLIQAAADHWPQEATTP